MNRRVIVLIVAIASLSGGASMAAAQAPHARAAATATLTGVITDALTHKPLAHVLLTVGYLTKGFQRAGETDAHGRYTLAGLPTARKIDAYSFKAGYFYFHGSTALHAGTTTYSHPMARDTTTVPHPRILSYYATPATANGIARLGMRAVQGTGPFSFEMMAISPDLGRLVVLQHGPGTHYDGTLPTTGIKAGTYTFYYVATQEDCYENTSFPSKRLRL